MKYELYHYDGYVSGSIGDLPSIEAFYNKTGISNVPFPLYIESDKCVDVLFFVQPTSVVVLDVDETLFLRKG